MQYSQTRQFVIVLGCTYFESCIDNTKGCHSPKIIYGIFGVVMDNSEQNVTRFTKFNFIFIDYSTQFRFISVVSKPIKIIFVLNGFFSSLIALW
jgi:hypothetical protein